MNTEIQQIIDENRRRNDDIFATFDPLTGEGSILERVKIVISDFKIQVQYIPKSMENIPFVRKLAKAGSISKFITDTLHAEPTKENRLKVMEKWVRLRSKHDFCFWAYFYVLIKNKAGGEDIHFRLNRPQRILVEQFERMRLAKKPIRLILLKARQWGGSTVTQIYMAWIQLVHKKGWNSIIVGHVSSASVEVKDMFKKMIEAYPVKMLHEMGEAYKQNEPKLVGGDSTNISYIPQRNCKIKIGTAESPNSARGGDSALVHCTEVAFWKKTEGRTPEQIIRSACAGALPVHLSMVVYESTADGTGNFFQREYDAAKKKDSIFKSLFIAWWQIEQYTMPVDDEQAFAEWLYSNRENSNTENSRQEPGQYYWKLWKMGATLQAIQWYIENRKTYADHADMAAEFPSDDVEAFKHTGTRVFDAYKVEDMKPYCKPPKFIGDVYADADTGADALKNLRFSEDKQGSVWIWALPEIFPDERVKDRYLTVVDVGGRGNKADYSVIAVFDRYWMMDGLQPSVVAQWYGHIDHDLLAWKAAQIAAFYDNALLVIESNTLETKDRDREVDGDQSSFILNQIKNVYDNLYARKQSPEDIVQGAERKFGFHTNVSTKPMIISMLVKVIREKLYIERDIRCLDEYLTYEKKQNGSFGAIAGKHDDLLMTRAIGLYICFQEMDTPKIVPISKKNRPEKKIISAATF